jgi:P4 family phage/plasmid primase-like protien
MRNIAYMKSTQNYTKETISSTLKRFSIRNKDDNITHTRIGNPTLGIFGGKYHISDENKTQFYQIYFNDVIVNKKKEYLTEKQIEISPILIDLDLRYSNDIQSKQHNDDDIIDIIQLYLQELSVMFTFQNNTSINVYHFEKTNIHIDKEKNIVKDGIHLIIGFNCNHDIQLILRDLVLDKIDNILSSLPITNTKDDVIDISISSGKTNWQLYGSQKPGYEPYKLCKSYTFTYSSDLNLFDMDVFDFKINSPESLQIVSCQYNHNIQNAELKQTYVQQLSEKELSKQNHIQNKLMSNSNNHSNSLSVISSTIHSFDELIMSIDSIETLTKITNEWLSKLSHQYYHIRETHLFTMELSSSYYDNFDKWIRVGWALHNTNHNMFLTWMLFSSKSHKFNISNIYTHYQEWNQFKSNGLTERSIMYWLKQDDMQKYNKIRESTIDYMIDLTIQSQTEWDIANVLYHIFKDTYRCANVKNNTWFYYKRHRWVEDSGSKLRYEISNTLSPLYTNKVDITIAQAMEYIDSNPTKSEQLKKKAGILSDISIRLRKTREKQNIMKEASEIFYENDEQFFSSLNKNPYLLCFSNGVYDFKANEFRSGYPEDYISISTNIRYIPVKRKSSQYIEIRDEINQYMEQLFPDPSLCQYMWQHLASVLIGVNKPQTFNIYNGCGRNGKSKLIELMTKCLGEYKGSVPTSLVTEKRAVVGGLTPEIAQLQGKRYAVMQEPSKGDKLNDGVMKQLTGEDEVQANPKYKDPVSFIPQFKLVVCTNNLFDIKSTDDGTWRRIRLCEFNSKFVSNPSKNPNDHEFLIDSNIDVKLERWKEVFMSMLIDVAKDKQGDVDDCDAVLQASRNYRKEQDSLMEYTKERLIKKDDDILHSVGGKEKIRWTTLYDDFKNWFTETYGRNIPKGKELKNFLVKNYGNQWASLYILRIQYDDDEDNDYDNEYDNEYDNTHNVTDDSNDDFKHIS